MTIMEMRMTADRLEEVAKSLRAGYRGEFLALVMYSQRHLQSSLPIRNMVYNKKKVTNLLDELEDK